MSSNDSEIGAGLVISAFPANFAQVEAGSALGDVDRLSDAEYEEAIRKWLDSVEPEYERLLYEQTLTEYTHMTDLHNEEISARREYWSEQLSEFKHQLGENVSHLDFSRITDPMIERKLRGSGTDTILTPGLQREREHLEGFVTKVYNTAEICSIDGLIASSNGNGPLKNGNGPLCRPSVEKWKLSHLEDILSHNRSYDLLLYVWTAWRNQTGKRMRKHYARIAEIDNIGARHMNFSDFGAVWRRDYEVDEPNFLEELDELWRRVFPLYEQLHAYVLRKLKEFYKDDIAANSVRIPAHLLGNMWAQNWGNVFDLTIPYSNAHSVDIGPALKQQRWTVKQMFQTAEKFFVSLGLPALPTSFWNLSILEEPRNGRAVACHASAWDFLNGRDFAIKMCGKVTATDFFVIHHEMGHIYYDIAYSKQSVFFRDAANPAFHEAVGDTIYLSAATRAYFKQIGLVRENVEDSEEADINSLMLVALDKVAFLPFGYMIDLWRWKVANGSISQRNLNGEWWNLRWQYQGVEPPLLRTEHDFDPGSKYHVAAGVPYVRYFLAHFLQYQFHKALCKTAKFRGPLHKCSVYGSKEAGKKLFNMLELGSSKPWPDALEALTGSRKPDARPLLDYFEPLYKWLIKENQKANACYGWGHIWPESFKHLLAYPRCANINSASNVRGLSSVLVLFGATHLLAVVATRFS